MPVKLLDHPSVRHYFDDDNTECTEYPAKVAKALKGTKPLIKAGHHALHRVEDVKHSKPYFGR